jgi:GTP pyrophosphokinase
MQRKGEEFLRQIFETKGVEYTTLAVEKLSKYHNLSLREDFLRGIGEGKIAVTDDDFDFLSGKVKQKGWRKFIPFVGKKNTKSEVASVHTGDLVKNINKKKTLPLTEEVLAQCVIAPCCRPIPGDDVMGYITPQNTLEIHKRSCEVATKHKTHFGNSIIATKWDTHRTMLFDTTIYIKGIDSQGVLYSIADVLHKQMQFVVRRITLETNDGIFEGSIELKVYDIEDVKTICTQLQQLDNVTKAVRID